MARDASLDDRMLDLLYGLAPDEEAASLYAQIESDPLARQAYERARKHAALLAEAAKIDHAEPSIDWAARERELAAASDGESARGGVTRVDGVETHVLKRWWRLPDADGLWPRAANWTMAVAAALLLLVAGSGVVIRQMQAARASSGPVRLQVVAPSAWQQGAAQAVAVRTTNASGAPLERPVELELVSPEGTVLAHRSATTNPHGEALFAIDVPEDLPQGTRLKVASGEVGPSAEGRLAVVPPEWLTYLEARCVEEASDRAVDCRTVTLSSTQLEAAEGLDLTYALQTANGEVVDLTADVARQGIAAVRLQGPDSDWREPVQVIAASAGGGFAAPALIDPSTDCSPESPVEAKQKGADLDLEDALAAGPPRDARPHRREAAVLRADKGQPSPPEIVVAPASDLPAELTFFPEGGRLVAGVENRVYFAARDAEGNPVDFEGIVADDAGDAVARLSTTFEGRGRFVLTPRADRTYAAGGDAGARAAAFELAPAQPEGVSLAVAQGVVDSNDPLRFRLHTSQAGLPVVASVVCRGAPVAQRALVLDTTTPVEIPLPREAAGVLRVVVHSYESSPPRFLAERLVYRRPPTGLAIALDSSEASPDRKATPAGPRLRLRVTDENGAPTACYLGVQIANKTSLSKTAAEDDSLTSYVFLKSQLPSGEPLPTGDRLLDGTREADRALDLVLGTQPLDLGPDARLLAQARRENSENARRAIPPAPLVFDNLSRLDSQAPSEQRAATRNSLGLLQVIVVIDLLGAFGLILLLAMLQTLRISAGPRQWAPALVVAMLAVFLGVLTLPPPGRRLPATPHAFASHGFGEHDGLDLAMGTDQPVREEPAAAGQITEPPEAAHLADRDDQGTPTGGEPASAALRGSPVSPRAEVPRAAAPPEGGSVGLQEPRQAEIFAKERQDRGGAMRFAVTPEEASRSSEHSFGRGLEESLLPRMMRSSSALPREAVDRAMEQSLPGSRNAGEPAASTPTPESAPLAVTPAPDMIGGHGGYASDGLSRPGDANDIATAEESDAEDANVSSIPTRGMSISGADVAADGWSPPASGLGSGAGVRSARNGVAGAPASPPMAADSPAAAAARPADSTAAPGPSADHEADDQEAAKPTPDTSDAPAGEAESRDAQHQKTQAVSRPSGQWFTKIEVPASGEVIIPIRSARLRANYRIRVTAHTLDGRLGAAEFTVVWPPSDEAPHDPAAAAHRAP